MATEVKTVYFTEAGPGNTEETLRLARIRVEQLGLRDIVVASSSGATGLKACERFAGYHLVVVAGAVGYPEPNTVRMPPEDRAALEAQGATVLFAGHAFGMLGRAINRKFGAIQVDEVIAHTLRIVGVGVKVACEIVCMATDAGLIRAGAEVLAIAGTAQGADTAALIKASNTHTFFDTRVREILCKPRV